MIIDFRDDKLSICSLSSEFKPRHKSQLNDWGFKQSQNGKDLYKEYNIEAVLPKIIRYFDKSKISFSISESCQTLLDKIESSTDEFFRILQLGLNLKNGEYDRNDFKDHIDFIRTNIHRTLKDHQVKASFHLWLIENGANFSVPGAGKTTVVLSVFERLRLMGKVNTLFVVGPPSCFGPWKDEYEFVIGTKPDCCILAGGDKILRQSEYYNSDNISNLYLTTFQTLLNDQEDVGSFLNNKNIDAYLVIDEAHYIKQINGNWANAVLNVARRSKYRCILTGTPIPKSYSDLFNLFDFLWPDNSPISVKDKTQLRISQESDNSNIPKRILSTSIGPLFYRVRKSELNLKPQVFNNPEIISMNPIERKVYDAIVRRIRNYSREDYLLNIELVNRLRRGRMIRLRQCASFVKLLDTAIDDYDENIIDEDKDLRALIHNYEDYEIPGKLTSLLNTVKRFQDHKLKVVIWAHFIGTIMLIEKHLIDSGFRCKKIIGDTPIERATIIDEETREKIRNEFVDASSGLDILIANPAACAESISLHKTCFNAVYYDLSYNCAQYLQSLDRIHRVGGSEDQEAYYYFLQYENTIDADILQNLNRKAQRMYDIIEGDYNIYSLDMFEGNEDLDAYERLFGERK